LSKKKTKKNGSIKTSSTAASFLVLSFTLLKKEERGKKKKNIIKMPPNPPSEPGPLRNWLSQINDNVLLSQLSLPGTHNSAAAHITLPSVQCQGASVTEQLNYGVRFLDIRVARTFFGLCCGPEDLQVIHGNFPVRLPVPVKLIDVLHDVYQFLQEQPSETVLVSIKHEGSDQWQEDEFPNLIWNKYIAPSQDRWYLKGDIPRLGDVRGKAVLFRRFGVKSDQLRSNFGFEASWWKYNTAYDEHDKFTVQDWSEVNEPTDFPTKVGYINEHLQRAVQFNATEEAVQQDRAKLFLNYCSGSNFFNPQCWPQGVATAVSAGITGLGHGCGIVIVDFAEHGDWAIVRQLVDANFKALAK
jgi:1-phosphatidylinositol phosphodiesterase